MTAVLAARGRSPVDHILRTAARGAALIGVAVVIGIVLLQVVDEGGGTGPTNGSTTNGTQPSGTTSTQPPDVRPPQEVRVLVLNGSGVAMAAATKANELRGQGYAIAGTGNAPVQQGTQVLCRAGFEAEADALATTVGQGTSIAPFPDPAPEGGDQADCIVVIGE
jgi:hypothetical protein